MSEPKADRVYRITNARINADGAEFEVPADATEDDIAQAAADAVAEFLSYGWEPADEPDPPAKPARKARKT